MNEINKIDRFVSKASKKINIKSIFHSRKIGLRAVWGAGTELLFLIIPIFLMLFSLMLQGKLTIISFLSLPDLSLLATVIFGLTVIKILQIPFDFLILNGFEALVGIVALILCFGLLPSSIVYTFVSGSQEKSFSLISWQLFFLVSSILVYSFFSFLSIATTIINLEASKAIVQETISELESK